MQPYLDLGPVRHDLRAQSFADFQFGSSAHRGLGGSWDTGYLRDETLCDQGMKVIADFMKTMPHHAPKTVAGLECLGGRIKTINADSTCFPHREAMWNFDIFSSWNLDDKAMKTSSLQWATDFYAAMQPWLSGGVYSNYPSLELENWGPTRQRLVDRVGRLTLDDMHPHTVKEPGHGQG